MLQIEGRNPLVEGLRSKQPIQKVYIQQNIARDEKIDEIIEICAKAKIPVESVPKSRLDKMSVTEVHQGIIGISRGFNYIKMKDMLDQVYASKRDPFFLIVRESMYEHNLGALLRTAACCGVNGVILTKKSDITPNVIRTSMGATFHLNICQMDVFSAIKDLHTENIKLVGIEIFETSKWYYESDMTGPIALIIGGEDHPLSKEISDKCDFTVKIPLLSDINSLNMSVAAGIVMYEKFRQEVVD